jgi:hypothetical protein
LLRSFLKLNIKASDFQKPSVITLILANLFPIFGILFLDWQVFPLLLLYWMENVTLGVLNVLKMCIASPNHPGLWLAKAFMIPFFCVHYGLFTAAHGSIIFSFFSEFVPSTADFPDWTSFTAIIVNYQLIWGMLAILVSHGISFGYNYIGKGEYKESDVGTLMFQPYSRVVILQVTIVIGGILVSILGSPALLLIILVFLKIAIDIFAHLRQHAKNEAVVLETEASHG